MYINKRHYRRCHMKCLYETTNDIHAENLLWCWIIKDALNEIKRTLAVCFDKNCINVITSLIRYKLLCIKHTFAWNTNGRQWNDNGQGCSSDAAHLTRLYKLSQKYAKNWSKRDFPLILTTFDNNWYFITADLPLNPHESFFLSECKWVKTSGKELNAGQHL